MHTTIKNNTTFVHNSDFSGPIKIVVGENEIETDIKSLASFMGITSPKSTPHQKVVIDTNYNVFKAVVNSHLENGWIVVNGTFQMQGITVNDDYEFRYGVVIEKS